MLFRSALASISCSSRNESLKAEVYEVYKKLGLISLVAVLIPLLYLPIFVAGLSAGGDAGVASAQLFSGYALPLLLRWILSIAGLGVLFYMIYKQAKVSQQAPMNMVYIALALVLTGEFIGRMLFYATAVAVSIG